MAKVNFMQVLGFATMAMTHVASADANGDGVTDGKEKMNLAKELLKDTLRSFPDLGAKFKNNPDKTEEFLDKLVDAFNVVVK